MEKAGRTRRQRRKEDKCRLSKKRRQKPRGHAERRRNRRCGKEEGMMSGSTARELGERRQSAGRTE